MRLTAAVFYYDYKDKQTGTTVYNPLITQGEGIGNMEKVEVTGGEVELAWAPTEHLTIIAGISNIDGKIKQFDQWDTGAAVAEGGTCDNQGNNPGTDVFLCNIIIHRRCSRRRRYLR